MSTMFEIQPIKLLRGTHSDTAQTGSGCFMNVIAYLNGEPRITDSSPCVCPTIRPIAIWLNDFADDEQRQSLLPFLLRAMGTKTADEKILAKRREIVVAFAKDMVDVARRAANTATGAGYIAGAAIGYICNAVGYADSCACAAHRAAFVCAADWEAALEAACAASSAAAAILNAGEDASMVASAVLRHAVDDLKREIFEKSLKCMEDICPPLSEPDNIVIERATRLYELSKV